MQRIISALLFLSACGGSGLAAGPLLRLAPPKACEASLQSLTSAEIANVIEQGRYLTYAGQRGVCGATYATSTFGIHFRADGSAFFRFDRAPRTGRYYVAGDQLCAVLPRLDSWAGEGQPIVEGRGEDVSCHRLYRDGNGLLYMQGPLMVDNLPAVVTFGTGRGDPFFIK